MLRKDKGKQGEDKNQMTPKIAFLKGRMGHVFGLIKVLFLNKHACNSRLTQVFARS